MADELLVGRQIPQLFVEAVIRIQVLDLHSWPVTPSAGAVTSIQRRKSNVPPQAPSLLLSQDSAAATSVAMAARREQIPFDMCADVPLAIEMVSRKRYRAVLADFDLVGSWDLFSSLSGQEQKPIGLAMLPAARSLSDAFAAGFTLAIHKPLSLQPVRLGLKAAYEFGRRARRSSPRAGISIPTQVGIAQDGVLRGSILNLCEKGACLALEQAVISGTFMTVRFALPGASMIDTGALVVWDRGWRAGVQFHRMHCRHRAGIEAWVRGAIGPAENAPIVAKHEPVGRRRTFDFLNSRLLL